MPTLLSSLRFECFLPFRSISTDGGSSADVALSSLSSLVPSVLSVDRHAERAF
jgi:hypothetical protein